MSKRERFGNRYVSRRKDGTFSKNVDVGRSLSADRRTNAKKKVKAGHGDKGDLKRAESKFDKLSNEIAKDYEKKGKSKEEAEEIGNATAYKIGVAKYGKRGMERKARAGRAKNAESFGAEMRDCPTCGGAMGKAGCFECGYGMNNAAWLQLFGADEKKQRGMKIAPKIQMVNYEDVMTEKMKNQNMKDAEEFDAQYVIVHGEDGRRKAHKTGLEERDGFTPQFINEVNTEQLGDYVPSDSAIGNVAFENHAESFGADYETRGATFQCPKDNCGCRGCYGCMGEDENPSCACCGYVFEDGATGMGEHTTYECSCGVRSCAGCIGEDDPTCPSCGIVFEHTTGPFDDDGNYIGNAEEFDADYTIVQRPHHVARVRNENIGGGVHGLKQFSKPGGLHHEMNLKGKMYDEENGRGWVKMDDKARTMFEELGYKISDFDVVGTTQDVVSKTGFNLPTGVASIAVVFIAYMTGKKYGN